MEMAYNKSRAVIAIVLVAIVATIVIYSLTNSNVKSLPKDTVREAKPQPFLATGDPVVAGKNQTKEHANNDIVVAKNSEAKLADNIVTIKSIDPLIKVTHDFPSSSAETNSYDIARNDDVNVQFVIWNNEPVSNLNVTVGNIAGNIDYAIKRVGYVSIKQKANAIDNPVNPSDGQYPDPLIDVTSSFNLAQNSVTPIWVSLHIPSTASTGALSISVKFSGGLAGNQQFSEEKNITLNIHNAIINSANYPWYANWLFIDIPTMGSTKKLKFLNNNNDPALFSDTYWKLTGNIASFMHNEDQNVIMIDPAKLASYTYQGDNLVVDLSAFDKMADIFQKNGVIGRIEGAHFCGRPGGWGTKYVLHYVKKDATGKAVFADGDPADPGVQQYYKVFLAALTDDLKKKNLFDKYYQHIADEPVDGNATSYLSALDVVNKFAPGIKTLDAIQTTKVADAITVPVPQLDFFAKNLDYFKNLISSGKEVWIYTSWLPQGTFGNRFIEQQALQHRLLFWVLARYNLKGVLSWGFNYWENTDVYNQSGKPESGDRVKPAGDGYLVYPKNGGLMSSIRMETLKDGFEDYALLQKLEQQNPQLANKLINQAVQNADHYITNVSDFRNIQKQLVDNIK